MSCHPPPPPAGYYQHQHQTYTIKPLLHSNLHHKSSSLQGPLLVNQFLYQLLLLLQPWSEHFWHFDLTTTKSVRELTILNEHELTIFTWFFRWPIIFFTIYSTPSSSCHVVPFVFWFILWLLKNNTSNFSIFVTIILVWLFIHIPIFLVHHAFSMWYRFFKCSDSIFNPIRFSNVPMKIQLLTCF